MVLEYSRTLQYVRCGVREVYDLVGPHWGRHHHTPVASFVLARVQAMRRRSGCLPC
jgi:hypothetical protein